MKRLLLASSIALMLLSSTATFAAPRHDDHDRKSEDRGDHDKRWSHDRGDDDEGHDRGRHDNGRHLGHYKQAFRRGERVPVVYLQPRYYVQDYRVYHLAPPPRGYRWVQPDDGRYLLIATATGLISQILGD